MEDWKLTLFIHFCIRCVHMGYVNLTDQQLIRLYEECLVMAEYIEDCSTQMTIKLCLGKLCRKTENFTKAITYIESALVMAVETNNICKEAYAYGELGLVYNSLGNSKQGLLYVEKCLAIAKETAGMRMLERMAYSYLGIIYHSKGEYQTAINCYEKGLAISKELNDKESEGYAYYHLGNTYWSLDMYEEAKTWYKKCLLVISLINDKEIEASVYERLSMFYQSCGKHDKTIRYSEKLLHLVKDNDDSEREAQVYGNLGNAYIFLHKDKEAIEYYTKQLVLAETMDFKEEIKSAHLRLGIVYYSMAKNVEAITHSEKLLTISIKTRDKKNQSLAYWILGIISHSVSDFYKALEYYKKSLNIALETNSKDDEMEVYMGMGDTYHSLGKYDEAISYQEKALRIAEELKDKNSKGTIYGNLGMVLGESLGEYADRPLKYCLEALSIAKETGNKEQELISNGNLGNIYTQLGKFHESFQCYEKVLVLQKETGYKENLHTTSANIGSTYNSLGDFDNAFKYFEKELSICQKSGNRQGEATAYRGQGIIHREQGKHQEAMDCSKISLTIAQEIGDKEGEGESYSNLGHAYLMQDKYNEALKCFEKSLGFAKEISSKKMELHAYANLGNLYHKSKKYQPAFHYYEKALRLAISQEDKHIEQLIRYNLGSLYHLTANIFKEMHLVNKMCMEKCKKHLEQSLQWCEWMFDHLHDRDHLKITIMDTFMLTYKFLTGVLIERREINEALIVSDRGRARALSDLLESKYSEFPQYGKNVILTYAEVDAILHTCKSEFCVLYFALLFPAVAIWVLAHEKPLFFVEVNVQGFQHRHLPTSQGNKDGSEIISKVVFAAYDAMNVRDTLNCEDRSLHHLPENVQLIKSDHSDCFVRGERQEEGETRAPDQNKPRFQEVAPNEQKNVEGNKNPLEMLYTDLIAPVMQNLTHEEVVIVPDGPLYMVPFAALRDPQTGLFLSEMKRIRLAPSLTTLKSLQECPADYHSKTGALVVGDPDSGTVLFQGEETTFWPLPKARHEAKIIGNILQVAPVIGAQATKDVIMERLHEGVAVIHIAAHGSTKGEIVLAPRTLTGGRMIPEEEDYLLTMQEVQETGIKAQLVVLSCCHSGRGEIRAEGIVGISRGFLAAGARAVVASLWAIDDEAALNFMVSFYTQLKMGESASKSLQEAMNDVRGDYEEPRHWAPFFLIGDDVTINL